KRPMPNRREAAKKTFFHMQRGCPGRERIQEAGSFEGEPHPSRDILHFSPGIEEITRREVQSAKCKVQSRTKSEVQSLGRRGGMGRFRSNDREPGTPAKQIQNTRDRGETMNVEP